MTAAASTPGGKTVFIDAVGTCSPNGIGDERLAAEPAVFGSHPEFPGRRVGRVPPFAPDEYLRHRKSLKLMSRSSLLGLAAARRALAGRWGSPEPTAAFAAEAEEGALFLAASENGGDFATIRRLLEVSVTAERTIDYGALGRFGLPLVNPLLSFQILNNMALCHIAIELGIGGPNGVLYASGGEGLLTFENAAAAVRAGAPWALAGGADSVVNEGALALLANDPMSEGAAIAVLAPDPRARASAVEWVGLSRPGLSSVAEGLAEIGASPPDRWVAIDRHRWRQPPREIAQDPKRPQLGERLSDRLGHLGAAGAALGVAFAVDRIRRGGCRSVGLVAEDQTGLSVALVQRAG